PGGSARDVIGVVRVPDARVDRLASLYAPKKTTWTQIQFVDSAAASQGRNAARGADLFASVRTCDALVAVVRDFQNPSVPTAGAGAAGAGGEAAGARRARDRGAGARGARGVPGRARGRGGRPHPGDPGLLRAARADLVLHRGAGRGAGLDGAPGRARGGRGGGDPHRPGARVHSRRGGELGEAAGGGRSGEGAREGVEPSRGP